MNARLLVLFLIPACLRAQSAVPLAPHPELRLDAIFRRDTTAVEAGAGVELPAGYYTRIGIIAAGGAQFSGGTSAATGRIDVIARFLLDPFRQQAGGLSLGGGLSVRAREHDRVRPYMLAVIDYEGAIWSSGIAPALQVGLGGGVRVGGALRWGSPNAR